MKYLLALIACLAFAPALAAQTALSQPETTVERYAASYDVNADGTFTGTVEILKRLNTKVAAETATPLLLSYNAELQAVEVVEAYALKQDGKRVNVSSTAIKTQLAPEATAAPEFTSFKQQSIAFPALKAGDAIFFKFRIRQTKPFFEGHFDILEFFPVNSLWNSVQVSISAPANYPLYWDAVEMEGGRLPDGADGRAHWLWKTQVKQTLDYEPGASDVLDYSPRLVVSNMQDYKELGAAYWAEAGKMAAVTPEIKQLAGEITKDITEPRAQARAIYEWVNKNVRYLAIMVGRGTIIPHAAPAILGNRYGDCKDYATLLQSLLAAKDIESAPVIVRADTALWFPKVPSIMYFNHVILYLPSLNIYLDATNPNTPFGILPLAEAGKQAFLAGERTGVVSIPRGTPEENQINSEAKLSILADGGVRAISSASYQGRMELLFRPIFADIKPEISSETVKLILAAYGHKGTGRFINISNAHQTGEAFTLQAEFDLTDAVKLPGPAALAIPAGLDFNSLADLARLVTLEKRRTTMLAGAFNVKQQFSLNFPQGINVTAVPPDINFENAAGRYLSSYKNENGAVTVRRELILKEDSYAPQEYAAFRELILKSVEDAKTQISYGPAKDYQPAKTAVAGATAPKSETSGETLSLEESLTLNLEGDKLTSKRAQQLETQLLANPKDLRTHALLLYYYAHGSETPAKHQARVRHRKWIIQNHPEADQSLYGFLERTETDYPELKAVWTEQVELKKTDAQVLFSAARFFRRMDTDIALKLLQQCQQLEPANYRWAGELGDLYAFMAGRKEGAEKTGLSVLALEQYEKAITLNKQERSRQRDRDRSALLRDAAEAAFDVDQLAKAKSYATELLLEYGHDLTAYSYSDAAHYGNIILGRIALREGDLAKAKEHLLIAGRTPKLAGRTFFIPDMNLVRELFAKNERDAVLEYLQLCGTIYESQQKVFQRWEQMVRKGETPSFNIYER